MSDICTAVLVYFLKVPIFVMQVSKVKTKLTREAGGLCQAQGDGMESVQRGASGGSEAFKVFASSKRPAHSNALSRKGLLSSDFGSF